MRIRYSPTHPSKPNQIEHIENGTGRVLINLGQAVELPIPRRGEKGWLEYRAEQVARSGAPDSYDVDPSAMQRALDEKFTTEPPNFPFANN
jgi:hypothetical protein